MILDTRLIDNLLGVQLIILALAVLTAGVYTLVLYRLEILLWINRKLLALINQRLGVSQ